MEFSLLANALLAVLLLHGFLRWEAKRGNALDCSRSLSDIAIGAILAGVLVGRLATMVTAGVNPLSHPGDIVIVRAGVSTGPATVAALATAAWLGRESPFGIADALAPAALAALAGWHGGCIVRDGCLGTPADLPWALTQAGSVVARHPVELYAGAGFLLAAVLLAAWERRGRRSDGLVAGIALAAAGAIRWLTEPFRLSLGPGPIAWYVAALVAGVVLVVWAVQRGSRTKGLSAPVG